MQRQFLKLEKLQARSEKRNIKSSEIAHFFDEVLHAQKSSSVSSHSLQELITEIYDQGELGSCTANAFCAAYKILCKDKTFKPSRLFFYFYERLAEDPNHNIADLTDSGADVMDGESYVQQKGICSEALWPYDVTKFDDQPPAECDVDALQHKLSTYKQITESHVKQYINSNTPVLLAISLYESFQSTNTAKTGIVTMPITKGHGVEEFIGGHEMLIVGYDDSKSTYTVLNSWGAGWGDKGYCHIPFEYIKSKLCVELTVYSL